MQLWRRRKEKGGRCRVTRNEWDGVVRPCYRLPGHATVAPEEGERGQVGLLLDCLRCSAGQYLSDPCVWHMVRKCFQISRQPNASYLLRSSAEGMLQQMVLTIFGTKFWPTNLEAPLLEIVELIEVRTSVEALEERSQRVRVESSGAPEAQRAEREHGPKGPSQKLQVYKPYGFRAMHFVLRFLAFLLAYGPGPRGQRQGM
eukprot:s739_g7.t2